MMLDTHTHFYDPTRPQGVPWPRSDSELYRPVLPADFRAAAEPCDVTGTVVVEASPWVSDNQWLLDLARDTPTIRGIIGRLDPMDQAFDAHLERFAADPLFRGIRLNGNALDSALQDTDCVKRLNTLAARGLTLDLLAGPSKADIVCRLCEQAPDLRIVLNHVASAPNTDGSLDSAWQAGLSKLAELPKVYCKLSGFVESASQQHNSVPTTPSFYEPAFDAMLATLGADRLLYASNWPVSERFADYATVCHIVREWSDRLSPTERWRIWTHNAHTAYGPLRHDHDARDDSNQERTSSCS